MAGDDRLSRREAQVAQLYADGRSYREIADLLCIAPATARTHLNTIYRKLNIRSKIELARFVEAERVKELPHPAQPGVESAPRPRTSDLDPAVARLLREIELDRYADAFAENAVDMEVMMTLSDSDLRELGIGAIGHRKRLLAAIQAQRERGDGSGGPATKLAEPDAQPALGPAAERRHLTILFVDLVGSTELSTQLDPEQMRDLLDDYHQAVAREVKRFEGHVANVVGDGVLVYFGWPQAHEDDAERAVWASLAVRSTVETLRSPGGMPLAVRIGIASGLVVVGQGMGQDAAVVGNTPNLASRLQGLAGPGQIVISLETAELVRGVFDVTDLGSQPIKGLGQPIHVFEVRGPHEQDARFEARVRRGLTGIVGRTLELGLLEECWRRSVAGEGQVVLLTGEPGIGKSRVLRALRDSENVLPASRTTVHCSPYHTQSALHPFAATLARSLATGGGDRESRRARLRHFLTESGNNSLHAFHALARLTSVAIDEDPPATDAQEERNLTLDALAALLLGAAHQQPRLLLIEDVHWIDPSSRELVNRLVDLVPVLPILLVITARPEFAPSWQHGSHLTALNLSKLDREQAALLADRTAEPTALSPAVREAIVARADGVPLFVEELTKAMLERCSETGEVQARQSDGETLMQIPETLHDILMARLDRIPAAKRVAQVASAIGRQFEHEVLQAAALWPDGLLNEGLDHLLRAGLLIRRGRPPAATYLFKHALIRDEAYQSLLLRDRRSVHGRILRALEQGRAAAAIEGTDAADAEALSILARHASLAELWPEAARYHHRAGLTARELWAIEEAIGQLREALDAFGHLGAEQPSNRDEHRDATISTALALCECLYFSGRFRESFDLLDGFRDQIAAIDDPRLRGRCRYWLARLTSRIGRHDGIQHLAELAIADSLSCGDKITTANAYNVLCVEHFFTGSPDDSVAAGRRAIALLGRDGPSEAIGFAHHYISLAHLFAGRFGLAIDATARVLEAADAIDHPRLGCYGRAIRGWSLGMSGRHQEGLQHLQEANALAPDEATRIFTVGYTGCVQLETGALDESAANLNEAFVACLAFPSPQFAALFGAVLADALRRLGRTPEAEQVAEKSLEIGRAAGSPFGVGLALRAQARLAGARSDQTLAIRLLEEAAQVLASAGAMFELARTYVDLASIDRRAPAGMTLEVPYAEKAEQLLRRLALTSTSVHGQGARVRAEARLTRSRGTARPGHRQTPDR